MDAKHAIPASYEKVDLPDIKLSHYPEGSETATPVAIITLNRPGKGNAFTPGMAQSLEHAFNMFHIDNRVKAIVLTGAGRLFCAGSDLGIGFKDGNKVAATDYRDIGGRVSVAMHRCQKPTVVALQGSAVGVSMTMTLPAAVRICHEKSKYGFVFTRRGLSLESCSSYFLPRLVGFSRAMFLTTTGGIYPPQRKYFGNLFAEALPDPGEVLPRALEIATDMVENVSPLASALSRSLLWQGARSVEEAHLLESRIFHHMIGSADHKEGVRAFFEKRKPVFLGNIEHNLPLDYPWWFETDISSKPRDGRNLGKL